MSITRRHLIGKASTAIGFVTASAYAQETNDDQNKIDNHDALPPDHAAVMPDHGICGEYGTWTVTYKVGENGIQPGGFIRVQLPDNWHAGPRNSGNGLQTTNPSGNNYVTAQASRPGVVLKTTIELVGKEKLIKNPRPSLDGRWERYVLVVRVKVAKGRLQQGDAISVTYGDRSKGSVGCRASAVTMTKPQPILIAVAPQGDGHSQLIQNKPTIEARPGAAVEMLVHLPSQAVAGKPMKALVALVDKEDNPVGHAAVINLRKASLPADFPKEVYIPPGKGYVEFNITPQQTGILRLTARTRSFELQAHSNPARITPTPHDQPIFWGDIHSHTWFSWDGVGDDSFNYARNISGLDFYAMADHAILPNKKGLTRGLSDFCKREYEALTERYYEPHRFVTIHAHECSYGKPYGHYNIYYRNKPGPLFYYEKDKLEEVWRQLDAGNALTIPHHTGKFPSGIDFSIRNPEFQRNIEIYSGHGLSECYDPKHPLAFEQSLFTGDGRSLQHLSFVQDAWIAGLRLSTMASSDDHRSHPGQPRYGLTAVRASQLTRDAVFQAFYDRCTYATTGAKIILDFSINGTPMGQQVKIESAPAVRIQAIGTDLIDRVELLKYQSPAKSFEVLQSWRPDSMEFEGDYVDRQHSSPAIYYMRLRQKYRIRGREVMAWSSPIWTV